MCGICTVACAESSCAAGAAQGVCVDANHPVHERICAGRSAPALCLSGCASDAECAPGLACLDQVCLASEAVAIVRATEDIEAPLSRAPLCADGPVLWRSVKVSSQAGIDALEGCERIVGDFEIDPFPEADVSPLRSLREVTGLLALVDLPPLADDPFQGLRSIRTAGGLELRGLRELQNLTPLPELRVDGTVRIEDCAGLTGLEGLAAFGVVPSLRIQGTSIPHLAGLEGLSSLEALILMDNPELVSLQGLSDSSQLTSLIVRNNPTLVDLALPPLPDHISVIELASNPVLTRLTGLEGLTSAERISLFGNAALPSLDALSGLVEVGTLEVITSPALVALTGLENLSRATTGLSFYDTGLIDLTGLSGLVEVGSLDVLNDANEGNALSQTFRSLAGLESLERLGQLGLHGNRELRSLAGLGNAEVESLELSRSALSNLSGLEQVTGLRSLRLADNAGLTSLAGFNCPSELSVVDISGSPDLTDLSALAPIVSASAAIVLQRTGVSQLDALQNLRSVPRIGLTGNANLTQIDALSGLESLETLEIDDNPVLRTLPVFPNLLIPRADPSIDVRGFQVRIARNAQLENGPGFPTMTAAAEIAIDANPELSTLNGFAALESVSGLTIERNAQLVDFDFGALIEVSSFLSVRGNAALSSEQLEYFRQLNVSGRRTVVGASLAPCPWIRDSQCDETHGACAPNTDLDCRP